MNPRVHMAGLFFFSDRATIDSGFYHQSCERFRSLDNPVMDSLICSTVKIRGIIGGDKP